MYMHPFSTDDCRWWPWETEFLIDLSPAIVYTTCMKLVEKRRMKVGFFQHFIAPVDCSRIPIKVTEVPREVIWKDRGCV